ncbi:uncharacterized protein METZ01_LOCUS362452, partial [marine metagenome]
MGSIKVKISAYIFYGLETISYFLGNAVIIGSSNNKIRKNKFIITI